MKKTIKTGRVTALYGILDAAKYTKMDSTARTSLIRAMRPMRRVANDYNEYREDAVKRLRPDNYDQVAGLVQKFAAMDAEAQKTAIAESPYKEALKTNYEFNTALNKCMADENEKEVELDFAPLPDEAFDGLCDSNPDWTLGQCVELQAVLCGEPNEKGGEA